MPKSCITDCKTEVDYMDKEKEMIIISLDCYVVKNIFFDPSSVQTVKFFVVKNIC